MKEISIAFARVLEKTVRGALWYCAGNHELLSCLSVLFFNVSESGKIPIFHNLTFLNS